MPTKKCTNILLAEDDASLGSVIKDGLRILGYLVDLVVDGGECDAALQRKRYDILILDIGLPKLDGYEVLEKVRNRGDDTAVLVLTARSLVEDRVKGLDLGADDYMVKPFDLDELAARLRALQRRFSANHSPFLTYNDIVIDIEMCKVTYNGEEVKLPRREFTLLQKFLENQGRVLSREHIMSFLYGWDDDIDSNTVEVHIHNLRKKFGANFVKTLRGIGYMVEKTKIRECD